MGKMTKFKLQKSNKDLSEDYLKTTCTFLYVRKSTCKVKKKRPEYNFRWSFTHKASLLACAVVEAK